MNTLGKKAIPAKRGEFSPDFFIKQGDQIFAVEVKGDEEIADPSADNIKKHEYATAHFDRLNDWLKNAKISTRYQFNMISPKNFNAFFQKLRCGDAVGFRSDLDVAMTKAAKSEHLGLALGCLPGRRARNSQRVEEGCEVLLGSSVNAARLSGENRRTRHFPGCPAAGASRAKWGVSGGVIENSKLLALIRGTNEMRFHLWGAMGSRLNAKPFASRGGQAKAERHHSDAYSS